MDKDNNDLPLSANIMDIRVRHYVFLLNPSLSSKIIFGKVILVMSLPTVCERKGKCCSDSCGCSFSNLGIGLKCVQGCNCNKKFDGIVDFRVILDSSNLHIHSVVEVVCDQKDLSPYLDPMSVKEDPADSREWFNYEKKALQFEVNCWSLQVWKQGVQCVDHFPAVICIEYHTLPEGNSISWRNDADSNLCFFTSGAPINNRSLFPYQDAPSAMATWEANVLTEASYYVSMTGDQPASLIEIDSCDGSISSDCRQGLCSGIPSTIYAQKNVLNCSYYFTALSLPMATIAIAVGKWNVHSVITPDQIKQTYFKCSEQTCKQFILEDNSLNTQFSCHHGPYPCIIKNTLKEENKLGGKIASSTSALEEYQESKACGTLMPDCHYHNVLLPTTVVFPNSLRDHVGPLDEFLPHCLSAASQLFGPHPCQRLEVVILPSTFSSLGLASPNLVFISSSVVTPGDTSTFIRIAHEISHSWFGIIIGAEDWTEEWLSEGFATFAEEAIFEKSCSTLLNSLREVEQSSHLHPEKIHKRISIPGMRKGWWDTATATNKPGSFEQICALQSKHVAFKVQCDLSGVDSMQSTSSSGVDSVQSTSSSGVDSVQSTSSSGVDSVQSTSSSGVDSVQSTSSEVLNGKSIHPQAQGHKRCCSGFFEGHKETKYSRGHSQIAEGAMSAEVAMSVEGAMSTEGAMSEDEHPSCKKSLSKSLLSVEKYQLVQDLSSLRTHIQFRNLIQEIDVSTDELQLLQPNKPGDNLGIVPNALHNDKGFLKIHYIKGYFLLKYLSTSVGAVVFLNFLKAYVLTFHGQLVTASKFVDYFYAHFPQFSAILSKVELVDLWLQQPGINNILRNQFGKISNHLIDLCQEHCQYWISKNRKSLKSKPLPNTFQFSDQILLFLEYLVEHEGPLKKNILSEIEKMYNLDKENSEIRHAWCELIIKQKHYARCEFVREFLKTEFAMGVYLYGELMIVHSKVWNNLARTVFEEVKESMDISARSVVQEMINPE